MISPCCLYPIRQSPWIVSNVQKNHQTLQHHPKCLQLHVPFNAFLPVNTQSHSRKQPPDPHRRKTTQHPTPSNHQTRMSFTQDLCDRAEYLDWHLIRLPPASTLNPCPICLSPYSSANPPFSLLECSHTFCQPCILALFTSEQENAHMCPLDRTELFLPRALDDPKRTVIHTIRG
jgi:hypothetical protein